MIVILAYLENNSKYRSISMGIARSSLSHYLVYILKQERVAQLTMKWFFSTYYGACRPQSMWSQEARHDWEAKHTHWHVLCSFLYTLTSVFYEPHKWTIGLLPQGGNFKSGKEKGKVVYLFSQNLRTGASSSVSPIMKSIIQTNAK